MQYIVLLGPIATSEIFQTGDTIELDESEAKPLLDLKVIEPKTNPIRISEGEKPKSPKSKPE